MLYNNINNKSKSKSNLNKRQPMLLLTTVNTVITLNNEDTVLNNNSISNIH